MWVIYNLGTGLEFDRVENYSDALDLVEDLNDNEYGYTYGKRWEE